jgi:hypothetical protein
MLAQIYIYNSSLELTINRNTEINKLPVVGIVRRGCSGVKNKQLLFLKAITRYKSSGFTMVKTLSVVKKQI